jgi:1-aminocyclopropane-1-carboxylate deaminase
MPDLTLHAITVEKISASVFIDNNVEVSVLRLDKIHPVISGNKWFKLRFYLDEAKQFQKKTIVTFGGAWSNHIVATAAACKSAGLGSVGIIRGGEATDLSPTLLQAKEAGMLLYFISREEYKEKKVPIEFQNDEYYFIPEGGYSEKGAAGATTILDYCEKKDFTHYCCAVGSGTMMAGLINGALPHQVITGISVLKNNFDQEADVKALLSNKERNFTIIHDYHFGGYAKHKRELIEFMNTFYQQTTIPSDFVYTGKLFYAIHDLINKNFFPPGSKLLLIHSGGLQGNASLSKGTLIF